MQQAVKPPYFKIAQPDVLAATRSAPPVLLVLSIAASNLVRQRKWDNTGNYRVEAEFQGIQGDTVTLAKMDGKLLKIPMAKLSEADRRFARTYQSAAVVKFRSGAGLRGTVLQAGGSHVVLLRQFSLLHYARSDIASIADADAEPEAAEKRPPRLPGYRAILVTTALQPWATDLRQIPSTVIDNGVLRNVPYKSYAVGEDYELNIYGDPIVPVGFEIGIRRDLLYDGDAKRNCIELICALLGTAEDRKAVRDLAFDKGKTVRDGLVFEITPPTDPDAYGGWWVSIYDEKALDSVRASDAEMKMITVAASSWKPQEKKRKPSDAEHESEVVDSVDSSQDAWSSQDLSYARSPAKKRSSGGSVYVRGYYRKDGTYVQAHTRSAPRR